MFAGERESRARTIWFVVASLSCAVVNVAALVLVWFGIAVYLHDPFIVFLFVIAQVALVCFLYAPVALNVVALLLVTRAKKTVITLVSVVLSCGNAGACVMHSYSAIKDAVQCQEGDETNNICAYEDLFCAGVVLALFSSAVTALVSVTILLQHMMQLQVNAAGTGYHSLAPSPINSKVDSTTMLPGDSVAIPEDEYVESSDNQAFSGKL